MPGNRQELAPGRGFDHVAVLPALLPNSKENTSSIAQNNGTSPATIVMDIYTTAGVQIPSATVVYPNVPPDGTRVFAQAINTGLTPGFRGVGVTSAVTSPSTRSSFATSNRTRSRSRTRFTTRTRPAATR
jgi:hypothetical protein